MSEAKVDKDGIWTGNPSEPRDLRLRAALLDANRRLVALTARKGDSDAVVKASSSCLERANSEAQRGARFVAWDCLHQFEAEMLASLEGDALLAKWCSLRAAAEEKDKLGSWRLKAAASLAKAVASGKPPPSDILREMQEHLAISSQNRQFKQEMAERAVPVIIAYLWGTVLALLIAIFFGLDKGFVLEDTAVRILLGVAAGAVGGLLSVAFSQFRLDFAAKIPDMQFSAMTTAARPALGAALALPVIFLINADVVTIGKIDKTTAVAIFCFLAGFSERWFLGVMSKLESGKK